MDARSAERGALFPDISHPPLDWRRQVSMARRWAWLFWLVATLAFMAAVLIILAIPQQYGAAADVVIDQRRERVVDLNQVLPDIAGDASAVDTEVEILKSRPLAEKVVSALALDRDAEFNPALRPPVWPWGGRAPVDGREAAVNRLIAHLKIARVGYTSLIGISARSRSPDRAAQIANAVAAAYLRQQLDAKTFAARRATDWLSARLGGLKAEVEAAEHEVERYKTAHGLMTLTDSQGATITEQEISNLDAQLATARGERAEAEARLAAARQQLAGGGQGDDVGEVLNSPVVQELRKQRDEAAKQIAELQGRYGPRHPDLLKAERQRTELDAQIQQETARVVSNLQVQTGVARGRSAAIASALANAKTTLAQSNGASVELKELERNLESVRTLYQSFLDRYKQTSAQDGLAQSDARIVSPAKIPQAPDFPNRPLLSAVALTGSLILGVLAIWIAEAREDGLYAADDVLRRLGTPCLGSVPAVGSKPAEDGGSPLSPVDLVLDQPLSAFAESLRSLKAGLLMTRGAGPIRTVAITSALPGEGKTTTCICLGRVLARGGAGVVVVDCDLRKRSMNRLLSEPSKIGLLDVLAERSTLEDALIADGDLMLLPLGDDAATDEDILESAAMDRVMETLRRQFRLVVFDTAPVLMVTQTRTLAAKTDAVLFLARWRRTPAEAAASAVRLLESACAHVLGAALTQVDVRYMDRRDYPYAALDYPFYGREPSEIGRALLNRRRKRP